MRKFIASITIALLLLPTAAFADTDQTAVPATLASNFNVTYNMVEQAFRDGNGKLVLPIVLDGITYLPVRAISGLVGLTADWNPDTKTVSLTSGGEVIDYTGIPRVDRDNDSVHQISVMLDPDIRITLDGITQTSKDNSRPFIYNGTTYLSVRTVCDMVNIPVSWDGKTKTVVLGTKPSDKADPVPAGARVITGDDMMQFDEYYPNTAVQYQNGTFLIKSESFWENQGIDFINDHYKTLTFTVTTDDVHELGEPDQGKLDQEVYVGAYDKEETTDLLRIPQAYGETKTYTVDITGYKDIIVQVRLADGDSASAALSNVYLTK